MSESSFRRKVTSENLPSGFQLLFWIARPFIEKQTTFSVFCNTNRLKLHWLLVHCFFRALFHRHIYWFHYIHFCAIDCFLFVELLQLTHCCFAHLNRNSDKLNMPGFVFIFSISRYPNAYYSQLDFSRTLFIMTTAFSMYKSLRRKYFRGGSSLPKSGQAELPNWWFSTLSIFVFHIITVWISSIILCPKFFWKGI